MRLSAKEGAAWAEQVRARHDVAFALSQLARKPKAATPRFGDMSKMLPIVYVLAIIAFLYIVYVFVHGVRVLQLDLDMEVGDNLQNQGALELVVFHAITAMVLYCLARSILTDPGSIPADAQWDLEQDLESSSRPDSMLLEQKENGKRRHCKWCLKYKPDRTHHCRVCNTCVLKMDHHCPFIYNCIGFRNHKYFFLLLLYTSIDLVFIATTMAKSVVDATKASVSFDVLLLLLFGEALAIGLTCLVGSFFAFHVMLMFKGITTLEFCEKYFRKGETKIQSPYSQGCLRGICDVLGPQPLLWLLPVALPPGDGVTWATGVNDGT